MLLLILAHRIPLGGTLLVHAHVEELRGDHNDDIVASDGNEHFVSSEVVGSVVRAVDVDADDIAGLHTPAILSVHRCENSVF